MATFLRTQVTARAASGEHSKHLLDSVSNLLEDGAAGWFADDDDTPERTVFIARSPNDALRWLCEHSNKKTLLQQVNTYYYQYNNAHDYSKGESQRGRNTEDQHNTEGLRITEDQRNTEGLRNTEDQRNAKDQRITEDLRNTEDQRNTNVGLGSDGEHNRDDGRNGNGKRNSSSRPNSNSGYDGEMVQLQKRSRKDEGSDAQTHNKAVQDGMLFNLTGIWGVDLAKEETRYLQFFYQYPDIGKSRAIKMIIAAVAVGSSSAYHDWAEIMQLWRHRSVEGRQLAIEATQADEQNTGDDIVTAEDKEKLRILGALNKKRSKMVKTMQHRWRVTTVHNQVRHKEQKLKEQKLKEQKAVSGKRGVSKSTIAREQAFKIPYRPKVTHETRTKERRNLAQMDQGKRWCSLNDEFGMGIFALMPPSRIPNTFIEYTLTVEQVLIWVRLLRTCNEGISEKCKQIQQLYEDCMDERAPPSVPLALETVQRWDEVDNSQLDSLLAPCVSS